MDPVNEHLKTVAETLFNSRLVIEKNPSVENITVFNMLLNGTIPRDVYGESIQRFVQFLFHNDRVEYYKYIDKADIRHITLLTTGTAIAGYLGVKEIVRIERTGDRYTVEPIDPATVTSTGVLTGMPTDSQPSSREQSPHPRKRGGRGRNRGVGMGDRENQRSDNRGNDNRGNDNRGNDNRGNDNRGNDSRRNDDNRNDNRRRNDDRGDRGDNRNRNNTNSRSDGAIQRKREPFPPMVLGVNTEMASRNQPRRQDDRGGNRSGNSTYKDKLVSRYPDEAKPVKQVVIPVIPVEAYQAMITEPKVVGKSARDQLDDISWGGDK